MFNPTAKFACMKLLNLLPRTGHLLLSTGLMLAGSSSVSASSILRQSRNITKQPQCIPTPLSQPRLLLSPAQTTDAPSFPYPDVHESDTQDISIPFEVNYDISDLTTPGLTLGEGQRVNVKEAANFVFISFDLTNGQYINLSEVIRWCTPNGVLTRTTTEPKCSRPSSHCA